MNDFENGAVAFLGKWVIAPAIALFLLWQLLAQAWSSAGIWIIIVPAALAGVAFFFWYRSNQRSAHPWD